MKTNTKKNIGVLDVLVIIFSIYVLGAMLIDTLMVLPPETSLLLNYIDNFICLIFFIDFVNNFYKAENKLIFMKWGWIDLIASIPAIGVFRLGRIFRLVRLLRIIKAFKTVNSLVNHMFKNKAEGTFTSVLVIALLLLVFSSIAILQFENDPNSNIKTAEDAIWWAYVTITTVGYGDKFPVTSEGRIIAVILMTAGVSIFGTFTAYISSWFVADNRANTKKHQDE